MNSKPPKLKRLLPWDTPICIEPAKRLRQRLLRIAVYVAFAGALIVPVIQFQTGMMRNVRKAAEFDQKHPDWTPAVAAQGGPRRPKASKGAIGRWSNAVRAFWAGDNIYLTHEQSCAAGRARGIRLHPNMPFVVILLSAVGYLPPSVMAMLWSLLKVATVIAALWMMAEIARDPDKPVPDWVMALGLGWSLLMITDDILHGNTNVFVLGVIVLHLWLFRRGRDVWSGVALALAICLKMTPAIFLLYWLYQRNWRLLVGATVGLGVMAIVIPVAAIGPDHYGVLMHSWLSNLIVPGLLEGAWYPIHINQSISGVFSRYFLPEGNPNGNIYWNPDDNPYAFQEEFRWISVAALSPGSVKMLLRICQAAVVVLIGWAVGLRKLPRDDGRRALHYGLVVIAMLLLNQRTWEHHGVVMLIAGVATWRAIAFGRFSRCMRAWALALTLAAGLVFWAGASDLVESVGKLLGKTSQEAEVLSDLVKAYGPMFYYLMLLLAAGVMMSVALRKGPNVYAEQRQKLFGNSAGEEAESASPDPS